MPAIKGIYEYSSKHLMNSDRTFGQIVCSLFRTFNFVVRRLMLENEKAAEPGIIVRREVVFAGVLPYPITFLCTDFICELFGRRRANMASMIAYLTALLDTIPFCLCTWWMSGSLKIDP
jgi:uncharacterized PurR-regulated membrane protein YhhQ (DUF165 family)